MKILNKILKGVHLIRTLLRLILPWLEYRLRMLMDLVNVMGNGHYGLYKRLMKHLSNQKSHIHYIYSKGYFY